MRIAIVAAALFAAAGMTWALQGKPINDTCPVKGVPVKNVTTTYKGKTIGFCWGGCKGQFDSNPEKFISNIPGLAPPPSRTAMSSIEEALKLGKEGKPVLLFFMDATPKCKPWLEALGDKSLDDVFAKVAYVAVEFKKDGDEEKKWKATGAPTVILIDASKDEAKEIKKLTSPVAAAVKKELADAIKKLEKK